MCKTEKPLSLSKHRPQAKSLIKYPAHCVQKAPMPLNVLGPCHPNKLAQSQRSPWCKQSNVPYQDPNIVCGTSGAAHKISELKKTVCDHALDLSAKRKLAVPDVFIKVEPKASNDKECGAMDLSAKRPRLKAEFDAKLGQSPFSHVEPVNYCKPKKEKEMYSPLSISTVPVKEEKRGADFSIPPAQLKFGAQYPPPRLPHPALESFARGLTRLPPDYACLRNVVPASPNHHNSPKLMYSSRLSMSSSLSSPVAHTYQAKGLYMREADKPPHKYHPSHSNSMHPSNIQHVKSPKSNMRLSIPRQPTPRDIPQQRIIPSTTTVRDLTSRQMPISKSSSPTAPPPAHNSRPPLSSSLLTTPELSTPPAVKRHTRPLGLEKMHSPTIRSAPSDKQFLHYSSTAAPPPAHSVQITTMGSMPPSAFHASKPPPGMMSPPVTYARDRAGVFSPPQVESVRPVRADNPPLSQSFGVASSKLSPAPHVGPHSAPPGYMALGSNQVSKVQVHLLAKLL